MRATGQVEPDAPHTRVVHALQLDGGHIGAHHRHASQGVGVSLESLKQQAVVSPHEAGLHENATPDPNCPALCLPHGQSGVVLRYIAGTGLTHPGLKDVKVRVNRASA